LKSNLESNGITLTESGVVQYLKSLRGEELAKAKEYFERTPNHIHTSFRDSIRKSTGWK
jgi:hypothetical protein